MNIYKRKESIIELVRSGLRKGLLRGSREFSWTWSCRRSKECFRMFRPVAAAAAREGVIHLHHTATGPRERCWRECFPEHLVRHGLIEKYQFSSRLDSNDLWTSETARVKPRSRFGSYAQRRNKMPEHRDPEGSFSVRVSPAPLSLTRTNPGNRCRAFAAGSLLVTQPGRRRQEVECKQGLDGRGG